MLAMRASASRALSAGLRCSGDTRFRRTPHDDNERDEKHGKQSAGNNEKVAQRDGACAKTRDRLG
jgi:hypothetical protein